MKIDKAIRTAPWPEPFAGNEKQHFRMTLTWPVVNHERLLVATFVWNASRKPSPDTRDFRLICSKKLPAAAILYKGGSRGSRKELSAAMGIHTGWCYPEISEKDEKALAKWLDKQLGNTQNHFMPELDAWVHSAISAELLRERDARGELRDEDVDLCPEELPEGIVEYIRHTVLPEDRTLIYQKGNTRGICYCCGRVVRASRVRFRQNEMVKCPDCGQTVFCYLNTSDQFKTEYVGNLAAIQKGKDGQTLFIRQWHIVRDPTAMWRDIPGQLKEICRYAIRGNHAAKWQLEAKEAAFMNVYRYDLKKWERVFNLSEIYDGTYSFYCPDNWKSILSGTSLQYCSLQDYIGSKDYRRNPIRFLMDWGRYPMVEKFWKAGYTNLVHERVEYPSKEYRDTVYWGRTSIRDSIRFPMRLLKIHEPERWTLADMQKVSELWQESCGGKITEKDIPDMARAMVAVEHIRDALGHASVHKILKYIGRRVEAEWDRWEKEKSAYAGRRPESPGTYRDYLKDCVKLHLNLDDPEVLFPKNLDAAHARTIAQVKYKENQINREAFSKEVQRLQWMAWEHDGLLIRLPVDGAELIAEGKFLHHCVGGYVDRMANGKTTILLIRRLSDPDTPFYTLEWLNGRVQQCRTLRNASYTEDEQVFSFVTAWTKELAKKGKKKKSATSAA